MGDLDINRIVALNCWCELNRFTSVSGLVANLCESGFELSYSVEYRGL